MCPPNQFCAAIVRDMRFVAHQDHAVGIAVADRHAKGRLAPLETLTAGGRLPIRCDVVVLETGILKVGGAPGFAAIVTAIYGVAVGRMETSAGVECIDRQRPGIGGEELMILGDGTVGPLVRLLGFGVQSLAHGRLPGLSAVPRAIEAATEFAVLLLAADGAIQHDEACGASEPPAKP